MTMLPLMDPRQSLRECAKQLVLLEDHLVHPSKRCPDCIGKHLLTAEAFAEEAVALNAEGEWAGFAGEVAEGVRELTGKAKDKSQRASMAVGARALRKKVVKKLGVAVPKKGPETGQVVAPLPAAGSPAHSIHIAVMQARSKLMAKHEIWDVFPKDGAIVVKVAPGGHSIPSIWMGFPVRTVRTAKPRLPEAVQAARVAFAAKPGVGAVSQGRGCIQVVATGAYRLPNKLYGWDVCVRPPGSLSLLMGLMGADADPKAGDRVIYRWKGEDRDQWWVGEVAPVGSTVSQDGTVVSSIPQDGYLAVVDTEQDSGSWWVQDGRYIVVKKPYLSDMIGSDFAKTTQHAMIDVIQGVVQAELPNWTENVRRRFTLALVVAAATMSRLNPYNADGEGVGLFELDATGVSPGTWLAEKGGTEKLVVASRQDPIESTRVVIERLVVEGIDKLARDDDSAGQFTKFVADRMRPWVDGGTSAVNVNLWMERGRDLASKPGVARWLGQAAVASASSPPAPSVPAPAPVSPPTQEQSPQPTGPVVPSQPLAAPLVVSPTSAPSTFTDLFSWATAPTEKDAFIDRWFDSPHVQRVMDGIERATGHEEAFIQAQRRGAKRLEQREARMAASTWEDLGVSINDAWPLTRAAVLYYELNDAKATRGALERAYSAPNVDPRVRDLIHRELAIMQGGKPSGGGLAALWARPEGKVLGIGLGVTLSLLALSVFGGRNV